MKIEISAFTNTLKKLKPVAAMNKIDTTFPKGIYIGNRTAIATSEMFSVRLDLPEASGNPFIIPMQAVDLLLGLPSNYESVDIEESNGNMVISCGSINATFACQHADDFAEHNLVEEAGTCTVDWEIFEARLNSVLYACAKDAGKPALQGVRLFTEDGYLNLIATDGFRLAWQQVECPTEYGIDCIVSQAALTRLVNLFDAEQLTIKTGKSGIVFESDGFCFTARLIDAVYPDMKKLIPQYENYANVQASEVVATMRRINTLCKNAKLCMLGSAIAVRGKSDSVSYSEDVYMSKDIGIRAEIGVCISYCLDAFSTLKAAGLETVEIGISAENTEIRPITIKAGTFTGLILPIRING